MNLTNLFPDAYIKKPICYNGIEVLFWGNGLGTRNICWMCFIDTHGLLVTSHFSQIPLFSPFEFLVMSRRAELSDSLLTGWLVTISRKPVHAILWSIFGLREWFCNRVSRRLLVLSLVAWVIYLVHPVLYRLKVIHHSVNQDRFDTVAVVVVGAVIDLAEVMDRHFLVKLIQCLLLNWIVILSGSYTSFRGFRVGSGFEFWTYPNATRMLLLVL